MDSLEPAYLPVELGGSIPASPPRAVLAALDAAVTVLDQLAATGVGVRVVVEGNRTVRFQVRSPEGRVIREIPAAAALDLLACGNADGFLRND